MKIYQQYGVIRDKAPEPVYIYKDRESAENQAKRMIGYYVVPFFLIEQTPYTQSILLTSFIEKAEHLIKKYNREKSKYWHFFFWLRRYLLTLFFPRLGLPKGQRRDWMTWGQYKRVKPY